MGKVGDTIRSSQKITDPKMREALAKYADTLSPEGAENLRRSVTRDAESVAGGFNPKAVASELTLAVQIRPEAAKPVLDELLGKEKAGALLKNLNSATSVGRDTLERDREKSESFLLTWKPSQPFVDMATKPQGDALADLRDAVSDAMKASMKPLTTPAAASAPAQRGK